MLLPFVAQLREIEKRLPEEAEEEKAHAATEVAVTWKAARILLLLQEAIM